jgi:hypothetical protein
MQRRVGAYLLIAVVSAPFHHAAAGGLPEIKTNPGNTVPECATPGRMLAFLKSRNADLNPRFESVASEYMRLGEQLGVRWDFAFYQMILETGTLSFRNGSRAGDVKPQQNNFAGLGATGRGEPGESFPDVPTGVRAHLEHLLLYSGERLASPVADRTRKVQEWGVLTAWQSRFKRPITFADLAEKWAPGASGYGRLLQGLQDNFAEFCRRPDPRPELLAEVRGVRMKTGAEPRMAEAPAPERPSGEDLARRAIEQGKVDDYNRRSALGALEPTKTPPVPFKVLNAPPPEADEAPARAREPEPKAAAAPAAIAGIPFRAGMTSAPSKPVVTENPQPQPKATVAAPPPPPPPPRTTATAEPPVKVAAAAAAAKPLAEAVPSGQKCRVWTASYGGQKALIIRSIIDKVVNFTVLDVNEGAESREADAFIAAYAKNGAVAGEFTSQAVALDKAFELCPEG